MSRFPDTKLDTQWVRSKRSLKNQVDPYVPYQILIEKEHSLDKKIESVGTVFLTNRECPFTCLMCDLWKNTTDKTVPVGAIPNQISYALEHFDKIDHLKLYNSGNFFDKKAIPPDDYRRIAALVAAFDSVLVESHPALINQHCFEFQEMIGGGLQVAMGLETVHPEVLPRLNKKMDVRAFEHAVGLLSNNHVPVRAFILLRPPFLSEREGIDWAKKSIRFAFDVGVECCVIIPVRAGNGALDWLRENHYFHPPAISSLEEVLDFGLGLGMGRVFADLWDLEQFSSCEHCFEDRKYRLNHINLYQEPQPGITCSCQESYWA